MFEGIKIESNITAPKVAKKVKVLDADLSLTRKEDEDGELQYLAPEMSISVVYAPRGVMQKIFAPFQGKKKLNENDEDKFRSAIVDHCWVDWSGVTLTNLTRISEWCYANYDLLKGKLEEEGLSDVSEIPWSSNSAKFVAKVMSVETFAMIQEAVLDLESFATQRAEQEKNS